VGVGFKVSDGYEEFCLKMLQKDHPNQTFRLNAKYGSEEMDVICEELLIVAECTLKIDDIIKVKIGIRKKQAVEEEFRRKCQAFYIMAMTIDRELLQEAQRLAGDAGIVLIHGLEFDHTVEDDDDFTSSE
jgi:hypothetical protein